MAFFSRSAQVVVHSVSGSRISSSTVSCELLVERSQLGLHFEIDLFPMILIAIGVYWLWPQRKTDSGSGS